MAAETEAAGTGAKSLMDSLKTKVGPLPLGVWVAAGGGLWFYLERRKAAASTSTSGQQIDSAGNVGTIDPTTGYVAGSQQDIAALGQSGIGGDTTSTDTQAGSGGQTAGQFATNDDWARAAVNYLVGLGIDPTTATQAIQQYLSSQTLTTAQQGDVNLAIQSLGAPPTLPSPSQTNPTPVQTQPGGTVNATNPPSGVHILSNNQSKNTLAVGWTKSANATSYNISMGTDTNASNGGVTTAPATQPAVTVGDLKPGTRYYFKVQAQPAATGAPWGGPVSATTPKS
jgi:hypothetical protein